MKSFLYSSIPAFKQFISRQWSLSQIHYDTFTQHIRKDTGKKKNVYRDLSAHWHMNKQASVYLTKSRGLTLKLHVQCFKHFQCGTWHIINIQSNVSVLHYTYTTHLQVSTVSCIYLLDTSCRQSRTPVYRVFSILPFQCSWSNLFLPHWKAAQGNDAPDLAQQGRNIQLSQHLFSSLTSATLRNGPSRAVSLNRLTLDL